MATTTAPRVRPSVRPAARRPAARRPAVTVSQGLSTRTACYWLARRLSPGAVLTLAVVYGVLPHLH